MTLQDPQQLATRAMTALRSGDFAAARKLLDELNAAGGTANSWIMQAQCCERLGDREAELRALDRALELEPRNLMALLAKGERHRALGDDRAAVSFYSLALKSAPAEVPAPLATALERASDYIQAAQQRFDGALENHLEQAGFPREARPERFAEALDIMAGRTAVQLQQPTSFFYPGLPQTCFYEPDQFGWAAAVEARAPAIRQELEQLIDSKAGFEPYVQRVAGRPSREHSLLDDERWSALYLLKDGNIVEEHATRCPNAMAALAAVPLPVVEGRQPMALFSVLKPRTHIPPHWGMLNTRLICHLPLIVPDGCRLRVGNHVRPVEAGRLMIFDDSIEHEAWNDSDETRVVLLFEIWRPELSDGERDALTAMFAAIGGYEAETASALSR